MMSTLFDMLSSDNAGIFYRPEMNAVTGGIIETLLLRQLVGWHVASDGKEFYKFIEPCGHDLYREGDSWTEEIGASAYQISRSLKKFEEMGLISRRSTIDRVTWYTVNEDAVNDLLKNVDFRKRTRDMLGKYANNGDGKGAKIRNSKNCDYADEKSSDRINRTKSTYNSSLSNTGTPGTCGGGVTADRERAADALEEKEEGARAPRASTGRLDYPHPCERMNASFEDYAKEERLLLLLKRAYAWARGIRAATVSRREVEDFVRILADKEDIVERAVLACFIIRREEKLREGSGNPREWPSDPVSFDYLVPVCKPSFTKYGCETIIEKFPPLDEEMKAAAFIALKLREGYTLDGVRKDEPDPDDAEDIMKYAHYTYIRAAVEELERRRTAAWVTR